MESHTYKKTEANWTAVWFD